MNVFLGVAFVIVFFLSMQNGFGMAYCLFVKSNWWSIINVAFLLVEQLLGYML